LQVEIVRINYGALKRRAAVLSKGNGINLYKTKKPKGGTLNFMPEPFDTTMPLLPGASLLTELILTDLWK
jgi:hypothetical protein